MEAGVWIAVLVMLGCHGPDTTGDAGMAGRVLDPRGFPVEGLAVQGMEAEEPTDADGRFAIRWKKPETYVHFTWKGAWYTRRYQPEDEGRVVEIRLASLRDVPLACEVDCAATFSWDLGEGLEARTTTRCEAGATTHLLGVPRATPTLSCRDGGAEIGATLIDGEEGLRVTRPPAPVRVEVRTEDAAPERCVVRVGDLVAQPSGDGFHVAEATGSVVVSAWCDGRPAVPRTVQDVEEVSLEWAATGPTLDLPGEPAADTLLLVADSGEEPGWMLRIPAGDAGTFPLPPLPAGTYRFALGDPDPIALAALDASASPPGTLRMGPDGHGVLRLEQDLGEGPVPITGP